MIDARVGDRIEIATSFTIVKIKGSPDGIRSQDGIIVRDYSGGEKIVPRWVFEYDFLNQRFQYTHIEMCPGDQFKVLNAEELPYDKVGNIWTVVRVESGPGLDKIWFDDDTFLYLPTAIDFLNEGRIMRYLPTAQTQSQTPSTKCLHPNKAQYISLISIDKNFTYCKDCGEKL